MALGPSRGLVAPDKSEVGPANTVRPIAREHATADPVGPRQDPVAGLPLRAEVGRRRVQQTTRALGELARTCHTTVSTVLQGAFAQLLMALTGQGDVAFGATLELT